MLNRVETNRSPVIDDSKCQQLLRILVCERLLPWFVRVVVRQVKFERGNDCVICFVFFLFGLFLFNRLIWFRASSGRAKQRVERFDSNRPPPPLLWCVVLCWIKGKHKKRRIYTDDISLYFYYWQRDKRNNHKKPHWGYWTLNWSLAADANSCDILPDVRCTSFHLAINRRLGRRRLAVPAFFSLSFTR